MEMLTTYKQNKYKDSYTVVIFDHY